MQKFIIPFITLLLLTIVFATAYFLDFIPAGTWDQDISLNLFTELLGVLLTLVFLTAYIDFRESKTIARRRKIALNSVRVATQWHAGFLFTLYKATSKSIPINSKSDYEFREIFDGEFIERVSQINLGADYASGTNWAGKFGNAFNEFRSDVEGLIDKHCQDLTIEDLELLEGLRNGDFMTIARTANLAPVAKEFRLLSPRTGKETVELEFKKYLSNLTELSDRFSQVGLPVKVRAHWAGNVAPKLGSAL